MNTASNDNDDTMLVQLTVAQLKQLIGEAVGAQIGTAVQIAQRGEYLTPEQIAERLGVSAASIRTLVSRDGLPVHTLGPRLQRFLWHEVAEWLEQRGKRRRGEDEPPAPVTTGPSSAERRISPLRRMRPVK